jgi:hypothetical protein
MVEDDDTREHDAIYADNPSAALLHWHYRLGHLPFKSLQSMAQQKLLPPALAKCKVTQCATCLYGRATKRAWRTRAPPNRISPRVITGPGDCISVDQLESTTPGLIAQIRGWITRDRYRAATIFVDHYSRLSYVYLQRSTKADETVIAKRAFEAYANSHGITIKHYHCDNGRFCEKDFMAHIKLKEQTISFSGVNAHFQNALAEKRIRDLQDSARTMLVHAKHRWPAAINSHLWPYALRAANEIHMHTPHSAGKAPIELFSQFESATDPKHFHPFGCPVYVLSDTMQRNGKGSKWQE